MSISLENLISALEAQPEDNIINFDFCRALPDSIDSSRGSYSELALGFSFDGEQKVAQLLEICRAAIGSTYTGYKGGEFVMELYTEVWVDNYGEWSSTEIIDITDLGYGYSIINTKHNED